VSEAAAKVAAAVKRSRRPSTEKRLSADEVRSLNDEVRSLNVALGGAPPPIDPKVLAELADRFAR